jgi:hypothetical protein|tara:strand:+ start:654 stop:1340 length:687 start_codon:yes stop_codon:yes gene_type:complete
MLALKLGLSLNNLKSSSGGWTPNSDGSVVAWYQYDTDIVFDPSTNLVSAWNDSANNHDMVQATVSEQPFNFPGAIAGIIFDGTNDNLQTTVQISLSGAFTVGIKCKIDATGKVLIADNTTNNEMFKITSSNNLRVRVDANTADLTLSSGTFGDGYIVVTRDASNNMGLWHNGVDQSVSETLSGTADIDAIGVRSSDLNPFDGTMYEIAIFSSESTALTANVNNRFSTL